MTGVLFGLVRETIARQYGEEFWCSLLEAGARNGRCGHAAEAEDPGGTPISDLPSDSLICWVGRQSVSSLARSYPSLFRRHESARSFVRSLNDGIPIGRILADGGPSPSPSLSFCDSMDGDLLVTVDDPADVCALVKGVIAGAADQFSEELAVEELKCVRTGDNRCVLRVRFGVPLAAGWDAGVSLRRAASAGS